MRKYIIAFWIGLVVVFSGCTDMVNVKPEQSVTYTNYFKSLKDAEALLTGVEADLRKLYWYNSTHDLFGMIVDESTYYVFDDTRNRSVKYMEGTWKEEYNTIYLADLILDNVNRFQVNKDELEPYILQAYFIKGFVYFMLAQKFGECILKKGGSLDFAKYPKSSVSEVLEAASNYAERALELPPFEEVTDNYGTPRNTKQYAGKGAAAALCAHIYAWRAAIEKKAEYWAKAEEYCSMIIEGKAGYFKLLDTPEEVCRKGMVALSDETIWEFYGTQLESIWSKGFEYIGFPIRPQINYAPGGNDPMYKILKTTIAKMYDTEDRRLDAYFWGFRSDSLFVVRNAAGTNTQIYRVINGSDTTYYEYNTTNRTNDVRTQLLARGDVVVAKYANNKMVYPFKFRGLAVDYTINNGWHELGWNNVEPMWRLADIYLLRAECRVRQGNNVSGAISDLNKVRSRAYGDDNHGYPNAHDRANGLDNDLQLAIFREREKEMIFERVAYRYYDVIRNGLDYIHRELPMAFSSLTEEDIEKGALYYALSKVCFENNDLVRQNQYWEKYLQN